MQSNDHSYSKDDFRAPTKAFSSPRSASPAPSASPPQPSAQALSPSWPPSAELAPLAQGLPCIAAQNSTQLSTRRQVSAEQSGLVAPIDLLAVLLLI